MNAARILEEEHKVILSVLDVLARVIERTRREGKIPEADAHDLVIFFREYADQCHHSKEEDSLFPAMEAAGFPSEGGPTAVMRMEHAMGRKLVTDMADELKRGSAEPFCARADEFHALLSQHIKKEDHCLFPIWVAD
jgi:hemerythrin-like domain-containing protein